MSSIGELDSEELEGHDDSDSEDPEGPEGHQGYERLGETTLATYQEFSRNALFQKLDQVSKENVNHGPDFYEESSIVYKCNDIVEIMRPNFKSGQSSLRYINSMKGVVLVKQVLETSTNYARFFTLSGIAEYVSNCPTYNGELLAEYYRVPYQSFNVTKNIRKLKLILAKKDPLHLISRWAFGKYIKVSIRPKIIIEETYVKTSTLHEFVEWYIQNKNVLPKIPEEKRVALELLTI